MLADTVSELTSGAATLNIDKFANMGGVAVCTLILLWILFRENPRRDNEHRKQITDLSSQFIAHTTAQEEYFRVERKRMEEEFRAERQRIEDNCRTERAKMWDEYRQVMRDAAIKPNRGRT